MSLYNNKMPHLPLKYEYNFIFKKYDEYVVRLLIYELTLYYFCAF
jgi:hypothetical protein